MGLKVPFVNMEVRYSEYRYNQYFFRIIIRTVFRISLTIMIRYNTAQIYCGTNFGISNAPQIISSHDHNLWIVKIARGHNIDEKRETLTHPSTGHDETVGLTLWFDDCKRVTGRKWWVNVGQSLSLVHLIQNREFLVLDRQSTGQSS